MPLPAVRCFLPRAGDNSKEKLGKIECLQSVNGALKCACAMRGESGAMGANYSFMRILCV